MTNITSGSPSQDETKSGPFAIGEDNEFFFSTPALAQRLDLIQHLIECSEQLVVVVGEVGSGKTTLSKQLLGQAHLLWRTCHVQASPALDSCSLLRQMMKSYGLHLSGSEFGDLTAYLESLEVHLDACQRSNLTPVLLVDDAHALPADTLGFLLSLAHSDENSIRLRTVLFAESKLVDRLNAPPFDTFCGGITHILDMPGFTEAQTGSYIHQWMSRAGLPQEILLDDIAIHRVHAESKGLPGHIHRLMRQALLENEESSSRQAETVENSLLSHLLGHKWQLVTAAGLLAVASLLIVINLQTGDAIKSQGLKDVPLDLPLPDQIASKDELAVVSGLERERALSEKPPSPKDRQAVIIPLGTVPGGAVRGKQEEDKKSSQILADLSPTSDVQAPQRKPPPKQQAELAVSLPTAPPPGTQPQLRAPLRADSSLQNPVSGGAGNSWLQAQHPEYHVLQLFGTHDKAGLDDFLVRHGLRGKVVPLATVRNGKTWYVAVYGPFPDRKKAQTAITTLPSEVRALKPWPRSVASLRKMVK